MTPGVVVSASEICRTPIELINSDAFKRVLSGFLEDRAGRDGEARDMFLSWGWLSEEGGTVIPGPDKAVQGPLWTFFLRKCEYCRIEHIGPFG